MQARDDVKEWLIARRRQLLLEHASANALSEVKGAIERLDAGTYGTCVMCGTHIAPLRLHVLPAAPMCIRCAARSGH
jgi:RNA polymerase-binding transcription factor DksA